MNSTNSVCNVEKRIVNAQLRKILSSTITKGQGNVKLFVHEALCNLFNHGRLY